MAVSREEVRKVRSQLSPFFGKDGRAELFIKAFIEPTAATNYEQSINETTAADIMKNELAVNMMKTEDYEEYTKKTGMSNNSVHYEFTDFLVQVALFHQSLGKIVGKQEQVAEIQKQLNTVINTSLVKATGLPNKQIYDEDVTFPTTIKIWSNQLISGTPPTTSSQRSLLYLLFSNRDPALKKEDDRGITDTNYAGALDKVASALSNYVFTKQITSPTPIFNALTVIDSGTNLVSSVRTDLTNNLKTAMKNFVDGLLRTKSTYTAADIRNLAYANIDSFDNLLVETIKNSISTSVQRFKTARPSAGTGSEASPGEKMIWQEVFNNWSNLSDKSRTFYNKYLNFYKNNQQITPGTDQWNESQASQYQVNLLKTDITTGKDVPRFVNLIPQYYHGGFSEIWYTTTSGAQQTTSTANPKAFKNLYEEIVRNKTITEFLNINLKPKIDQNAVFHMNIDKLIRTRLFKLREQMKAPSFKAKESLLSMTDKNIWREDANGDLYKVLPSGETVYYKQDSEATKKVLKANFKCYSSLVHLDEAKCKKYMLQCLTNPDPKSVADCLETWKDKNVYDIAKEDIKDMHPLVAVRTLQKFGFQEHTVYDPECGMNLRKIQDVDSWIKNFLNVKFSDVNAQEAIRGNGKLLEYLRLLTEYVNLNPQVLNGKQINARTSESTGRTQRTELAIKLNIPLRKEPKRSSPYAGLFDSLMLKSNLSSSYYGQSMRRNALKSPSYRSPMSGSSFSFPFFSQQGGYHVDTSSSFRALKEGTCGGYYVLKKLISGTLLDLKGMGKKLDPEDEKAIDQKLEQIRALEEDLIKTEIYLEACKDLRNTFEGYNTEFLTMDTIRNLAAKRGEILGRKFEGEDKLSNICVSLNKLKCGKTDDFQESYKPIEY